MNSVDETPVTPGTSAYYPCTYPDSKRANITEAIPAGRPRQLHSTWPRGNRVPLGQDIADDACAYQCAGQGDFVSHLAGATRLYFESRWIVSR